MDRTRSIDFGTLSVLDALDLAMLIEEEAMDRYGEFADQMERTHNLVATAFFTFMHQVENKHRVALEAQRRKRFGDAPRTVSREMIFDIEAPEYDEARAFMTAREALETALRAEEKAHQFFVEALEKIESPEVKALFAELRDEELEHQDLVKRQLDKLPPEPALRTEDYADEPNEQ
jgi:rubrerythrin